MKTLLRMMLSTALVVVLVANVSAQGRPGGGMGVGGRGMSAYGVLATSKPLQEELKVSEEQVKKLEEAMKPIGEKLREAMGGRGQGGQRPTEEEMKKRTEAMTAIAADTKKVVEGVLKPEQTKRLTEINFQMMGINAFSDEAVQKSLKVTDSQKDKIKNIMTEYREDSMKLFAGGGRPMGGQPSEEDRKKMEENRKKMTALGKETADKVEELLTDDQKKEWKTMIGEKVDTLKFMPQFGGQRPRRDN